MSLGTAMKIAIGVGVVAAGGWYGWTSLYADRASELTAQLDDLRSQSAAYEGALRRAPVQRRRLRELESRLVGGALDELDNGLRVAVRGVGEMAGLSGIKVDTDAQPRGVRNPYAEAREMRRNPIGKALRESPDFWILRATLSGEGSLEQVLRAIAGAESQAWIHRVDQVAIDPVGKERQRFEVSLSMWVAYSRSPEAMDPGELVVKPPSPERVERLRPILEDNPFRYDPPPDPAPEPEEPAETKEPSPPPPPPYHEWRVWGVMESRLGTEVGVRNERTGQSLLLSEGARVPGLKARFVGGSVWGAVFQIEGERYVVGLNETLADREPATDAEGGEDPPIL